MTVPNTNVSIGQIKNEFGVGSNTITTGEGLSEYYKDGDPIPATTVNAAIPASGEISLADFKGASIKPPTTSLTASAASFSQINLLWSDVSNDVGYQVERSLDNITFGSTVNLGKNVVTYSYTGLASNTTYYFRVRSWATDGLANIVYSDWSTSASAKTSTNVPSAPSNLRLSTRTTSSITMLWNDNSTNESGFYIDRSLNNVNWSYGIAAPGANSTSYTDSGLASSTTYYYQVRAYNADGASASSNTLTASTSSPPPPPPPPSAPTITGAQWSPSSITAGGSSTISWTTTNATSSTFSVTGGNPSSGSNNTSVTFSSSGTYTATITAKGPGGTVYAYPQINVGVPAATVAAVRIGKTSTGFDPAFIPASTTTFTDEDGGPLGTAPVGTVNEPNSLYVGVWVNNGVLNSTVITISANNLVSGDLMLSTGSAVSGSGQIVAGQNTGDARLAQYRMWAVTDYKTEGNRSITITATVGSTSATSNTLTITDSSTTTFRIDPYPFQPYDFGFVVLGNSTGTLIVYFSENVSAGNFSWNISSNQGGDSPTLFNLTVPGNANYVTIAPVFGHNWRMDTTYTVTFNSGALKSSASNVSIGTLSKSFYNSL